MNVVKRILYKKMKVYTWHIAKLGHKRSTRTDSFHLYYSGREAPSHKMGFVSFESFLFVCRFCTWTLIGSRPDDTFFVSLLITC